MKSNVVSDSEVIFSFLSRSQMIFERSTSKFSYSYCDKNQKIKPNNDKIRNIEKYIF